MIDPFTQHDLNKQHEAEGEGPIAYDWHNGEVYPGDDIYTLSDVSAQLGGVNKDKFKRRALDRYYDDLTIENGGPVVYPDNWPRQSKGKPWRFKATHGYLVRCTL